MEISTFVELANSEESKTPNKKRISVLEDGEGSYIKQEPKRRNIRKEAIEIAVADDMFYIIQNLQILTSNCFINKFLDLNFKLNYLMKPIPYQNLLCSDSADLIIDSQSIILIVSLSQFDYCNENGKVIFQKSLIENLHHIDSNFNHLCLIFEDRYAQNKQINFTEYVKAILPDVCPNITVKTCFGFTTDAILKKIFYFIRKAFRNSKQKVNCWKNRDFLLSKERVNKLTDAGVNPFVDKTTGIVEMHAE
jgi:hypothetical protein